MCRPVESDLTRYSENPVASAPDPWLRPLAPTRPPIIVRDCDVADLMAVAFDGLMTSPRIAGGLLQEVERATKVSERQEWSGVAVLGSRVLYRRDLVEAPRWITLVKPGAADSPNGALSVLTTIGAGLLGLAIGQSIMWDDRCGSALRLEIINIIDPDD